MSSNNLLAEELDIVKLLEAAGLPEDLPEVALIGARYPDSQAVMRIKDLTLRKAGVRENQRVRSSRGGLIQASKRSRWSWAVAAVLVIAIVATAAVGPQQVVAGIRGMLKYVPGFGLQDAQEVTLSAERQVTVRRGGMVLEVMGLVADSKVTVLRLRATGTVEGGLETFTGSAGSTGDGELLPYLMDASGRRYRRISYSISSGSGINNTTEGWIGFEPLPSSTRRVAVVLPDPTGSAGTWQVEIPLVTGAALVAAEGIGPTAYLRGVAVTAVAGRRTDETVVNLLLRTDQPGTVVEEVGIPLLRDDRGKEYPFLPEDSRTGGTPYELRELRFAPVEPAAGSLKLSIPSMRIKEPGSAKISLPVPVRDPVELDRVVQLGRFNFKLLRAERVEREMRVYVDMGPNGDEALESFSADQSWMWVMDEQTKRMVYFQVPVQSGEKKLTLTIKGPVMTVSGPWELIIPVER